MRDLTVYEGWLSKYEYCPLVWHPYSHQLLFVFTETTAAAEPAPEEFDNSTYKNLQHHEYNTYTFVDSVAVLSKFRQPQPSSGRPSPRH